jgi:hypothetical protein
MDTFGEMHDQGWSRYSKKGKERVVWALGYTFRGRQSSMYYIRSSRGGKGKGNKKKKKVAQAKLRNLLHLPPRGKKKMEPGMLF